MDSVPPLLGLTWSLHDLSGRSDRDAAPNLTFGEPLRSSVPLESCATGDCIADAPDDPDGSGRAGSETAETVA